MTISERQEAILYLQQGHVGVAALVQGALRRRAVPGNAKQVANRRQDARLCALQVSHHLELEETPLESSCCPSSCLTPPASPGTV